MDIRGMYTKCPSERLTERLMATICVGIDLRREYRVSLFSARNE